MDQVDKALVQRTPLILRLFGFVVRASQLLGRKRVASKLTFQAWYTPFKSRLSEEQKELLNSSDKADITLQHSQCKVYTWGKGEKIVYLLHGWNGMAADFICLINQLKDRYKVVAIDAPGHGGSPSAKTDFYKIRDSLMAAIELHGQPYALVGHSAGTIPSIMAINSGVQVEKFISISPPMGSDSILEKFALTLKLSSKMMKAHTDRIKRTYGEDTFIETSMEYLVGKNEMEAICLIAENDNVVPVVESDRLKQVWKNAQFFHVSDTGHYSIMKNSEALTIVNDHIESLDSKQRCI